ncbi:rhamnose ABC transporter substrate-binding protein [Pelagibacterium sp. 26DY04]|uniref:rhamnose ABC transporter substrate-binding protein n=1 Tax=Pelagibacterium sp. 26DY04 TaxID=2967130 RepID=UPI0028155B40|nr:rhamnose ABC transporter substrate-binding protein [Pelagibacterium sp. 26DY04]WMT87530.1 rhamnose ABC transporter substrate-binding protein [Pelagibacterium sp. 26DY04]
MSLVRTLLATTAMAAAMMAVAMPAQAQTRIALVAKSLGNGFFEAAARGAEEAAEEIGDVEIIYTGPTSTTAEGQIEVINTLIAQNVDAIAISANDPDAVVPALQRAMERGITVISWDSGVAPEGRQMHLNPSSNELIGRMNLQLVEAHMPEGESDFAILSATTTSTNQNIWIEEMEAQMGDFPDLNLVTTVYGDDLADKSYREAQGILQSMPNVKVIVAPTTVGILAASRAVEDAGMIGEVYVTGLGLPSEMAGAIESGATKEFAIWNPVDLGYSAAYIAYELASENATVEPGATISIGRVGEITLDDNLEAGMSEPFVYDASNIDEFKDIF